MKINAQINKKQKKKLNQIRKIKRNTFNAQRR